jgi:hypothetical protein
MPPAKKRNKNRVSFWCPPLWRVRLLDVLSADGRKQGEFIRAALFPAIERSEASKKK